MLILLSLGSHHTHPHPLEAFWRAVPLGKNQKSNEVSTSIVLVGSPEKQCRGGDRERRRERQRNGQTAFKEFAHGFMEAAKSIIYWAGLQAGDLGKS